MEKTRACRLIGLVALGLLGPGRVGWTDQTPQFTIALWVRDSAQVPFEVLGGAQAEVARIYRKAGVKVIWQSSSARSGADLNQESHPIVIEVLSRERAHRLHLTPACDALGAAPGSVIGRGRVAYVLYQCIENLTRHSGLDRPHALGIVMAHEIGHLLLPHNSHSRTGLMRADWSRAELHLAQRGLLLFTTEQGELIRSRMAGAPQP